MARQASADPVQKLTISIPKSLLTEARKRAAEFKMDFSKYIQHLVSTDCALRPPELQRHTPSAGGIWRVSSVAMSEEVLERALDQVADEIASELQHEQSAEASARSKRPGQSPASSHRKPKRQE